MYASFEVISRVKNYRVSIGEGLLGSRTWAEREHLYLCDQFFTPKLVADGRSVISLVATEQAKSLDSMSEVIIRMREARATRETLLIAIGGGVIQDVATFCSSVYMRGIPWLYLPSTLLGMVDSCIGGKSAINVGPYKNIVGNYYPPEAILIDPGLTQSLGVEQKIGGLCESAKICYARGADEFQKYLSLEPTIDMSGMPLARLIDLSLGAKKWFVETDEFDQGVRLLLNFGHTFGHAIEGATGFRISHGVAVGIGVLAALYHARVSRGIGRLAPRAVVLEQHIRFLLGHIHDLPAVLASTSPSSLFDRFRADKKHTTENYVIISVDPRGDLQMFRLPRSAERDEELLRVFAAMLEPGFLGAESISE